MFLDREFTAKLRVIKKDADTKQTVLIPNTEFKIFNLDTKKYVSMITTYPSKVTHTSYRRGWRFNSAGGIKAGQIPY